MARRAACHLAAPSPLERPMPLIAFARLLFSLLSLVLLGACAYLLWSWYEGDLVRDANGVLYLVREDWRLWTGLAFLAWSFLGRWIVTPFIAGKDKDRPVRRSSCSPTAGAWTVRSGVTPSAISPGIG
jgi:hypothetical protein